MSAAHVFGIIARVEGQGPVKIFKHQDAPPSTAKTHEALINHSQIACWFQQQSEHDAQAFLQ